MRGNGLPEYREASDKPATRPPSEPGRRRPGVRGLASALTLAVLMIGSFFGPARAAESVPAVNVILWFDTEDYILPASDDAAKHVAEILTERGVRGTFKVVGEKARTLERRGRQDVIAALKQHAVAYHANFHSVHPTPSEYLADCGFLDGVAEFVRREGGGAADVRRIFGVNTLACYGQPGSSWAAQAIAALGQIGVGTGGVPCYVDDGEHVGLNHQPFWFENAVVVYDMGPNVTRMDLHDPAALEPAEKKVAAIAERLRAENGGGLISIYYHPCEWVHRQFWDGVNFSRGANPPREQWKAPPQRPPEETERAFRQFAAYVDFIRSLPGVHFVTASDLPRLYPDRARNPGASEADLQAIATPLAQETPGGADFCVLGNTAFSLADQFELLTHAVANQITGHNLHFPLPAVGLFGPDQPPPSASPDAGRVIPWPAFRAATLDVWDYVQKNRRVPPRVFIGAQPVPPVDFLASLAAVYLHFTQDQRPPAQGVTFHVGREVLPARHVAQDTSGLFGGWIIHPAGFRAPKILEVARLQAWTLKPALR